LPALGLSVCLALNVRLPSRDEAEAEDEALPLEEASHAAGSAGNAPDQNDEAQAPPTPGAGAIVDDAVDDGEDQLISRWQPPEPKKRPMTPLLVRDSRARSAWTITLLVVAFLCGASGACALFLSDNETLVALISWVVACACQFLLVETAWVFTITFATSSVAVVVRVAEVKPRSKTQPVVPVDAVQKAIEAAAAHDDAVTRVQAIARGRAVRKAAPAQPVFHY